MVLNDLKLAELVVWDREAYPSLLSDMVQRYGEGPFKVVGLQFWPNKEDEASDMSSDLSIAPYMVTVKVPGGTRQNFAGEWFARAKQKADA